MKCKRLLAMLLAAVMTASSLSALPARAASEDTDDAIAARWPTRD